MRNVAIALATILALSVYGCGKKEDAAQAPAAPSVAQTAPAAQEPATPVVPAGEPAAAATAEPVAAAAPVTDAK